MMNRTYIIYIIAVLEYFCPFVRQGFQLIIVVAFFTCLDKMVPLALELALLKLK